MTILVIDAWLPTPDRDSASLRMFNLLQLLCEFSTVTFAADDFAARQSGLPAVQALGVEVITAPVIEHLTVCGSSYDIIFLSRVNVAEKYLSLARRHAPRARIVFDTTDLAYVREFRGAKVLGNLNLLRRALETKTTELGLMRAADLTLVVSKAEQTMLATDCPEASVRVLSNIHDVYPTARAFDERYGLVFIGAFPHHPNADAMEYFCRDILPHVRAQLGDVKITIIGSQPPQWLQDMQTENLVITHHVPDVAPYLDACRATIAPLRYGSGIKGKVLLSMGYGVPVVGTTIAAEGIPVTARPNMLIADDAVSFATALRKVYQDRTLWEALSADGKQVVAQNFSRDAARTSLQTLFRELELD